MAPFREQSMRSEGKVRKYQKRNKGFNKNTTKIVRKTQTAYVVFNNEPRYKKKIQVSTCDVNAHLSSVAKPLQ